MKFTFVLLGLVLGCIAWSSSVETIPRKTVGLQLYSLRDQFKKDVAHTLDQVRAFGITNVELAGTYGVAPEKFKEQLDARQIKAISAHFPYEQCRDDIESVGDAIEEEFDVSLTDAEWDVIETRTGNDDNPAGSVILVGASVWRFAHSSA